MSKEDKEIDLNLTIEDFYNSIQLEMINFNETSKCCYITSRTTENSISDIKYICTFIKKICKDFLIPTEGVFLKKSDESIRAFKYLVCNTAFDSQSLLSDDTGSSHLVDIHPPYSKYLLIEILWHLNFEDILAESILHFPLDICIEILEVLPRCIDLLDSHRATKFLSTIIPNVYKKLILMRDIGSQTKDIIKGVELIAGNLQELVLQFTNERFLKLDSALKVEQYKKYGILLKTIIQMVRTCFTSKSKKVELQCELEKMYKLTFGWAPFKMIDDSVLQKYLAEIDRELMNLLLKKVKEIDCNIYLNWTEYDDEENTSLTLQRAIGLECYFFIESTKDLKNDENKEYDHLVECLSQLVSKPDPKNSVESMQLEDLCYEAKEGKKDCLLALFQRYKEWNDAVINTIDSKVSLLNKDDCIKLFGQLSTYLSQSSDKMHFEKLEVYTLSLAKALALQKIVDLYEIIIALVLKFHNDDKMENCIDIKNFERFIKFNPSISNAKNLRVVLFFLCLKTKSTLNILLKMAIGHSDYPDVAMSLDDLLLLMPVMQIQIRNKCVPLIDVLRDECPVKEKYVLEKVMTKSSVKTITLAVKVLQEICLGGGFWNIKKFSDLLDFLSTFCKVSEIINEVFIPFLLSNACTIPNLRMILTELLKFSNKIDKDVNTDLIHVLDKCAFNLLNHNRISRYVIDELSNLIFHMRHDLLNGPKCIISNEQYESSKERLGIRDNRQLIFLAEHMGKLLYVVDVYINLHANQLFSQDLIAKYPLQLIVDDVLRYLYTKCTEKQYMEYAAELIKTYGKVIMSHCTDLEIIDTIIRVTFETSLLCLEFPEVAAPESISFLFRCLHKLLVTVIKDSSKYLRKSLLSSLNKHVHILEPNIEKTAIVEAYKKLLCNSTESNLDIQVKALENFAMECVTKGEKLQAFEGPHSPIAIKLWLAYDLVRKAIAEGIEAEEYICRLNDIFKSTEREVV